MVEPHDVLAILSEVSGVPAPDIRPDMDLVADLGIDSPKALRLLVELEERLDVEITDEQAGSIGTVGDVLEFVGSAR